VVLIDCLQPLTDGSDGLGDLAAGNLIEPVSSGGEQGLKELDSLVVDRVLVVALQVLEEIEVGTENELAAILIAVFPEGDYNTFSDFQLWHERNGYQFQAEVDSYCI